MPNDGQSSLQEDTHFSDNSVVFKAEDKTSRKQTCLL